MATKSANEDRRLHVNLPAKISQEFRHVRSRLPLRPTVQSLIEMAMERGLEIIKKEFGLNK